MTFRLRARFAGLSFRLRARLAGLTFRLRTRLAGLTFRLRARLSWLTFRLPTRLSGLTFRLRARLARLAFRLRARLAWLTFRLGARLGWLTFRLRTRLSRLTFRLRTRLAWLAFRLRARLAWLTFRLGVIGHGELVGGLFGGAFRLPQRGGGSGVDLGSLLGQFLGFVGLFGELFGRFLGGIGDRLFQGLFRLGERFAGLLLGILRGCFVALGEGVLGSLGRLFGGFELLAGFGIAHPGRILRFLGFLGDGGLGLGVRLASRLPFRGVRHVFGGVGGFRECLAGLLPGLFGAGWLVVQRFLGGLSGGFSGLFQRLGRFALRFLGEFGGLIGRFLLFGGGIHGVVRLSVLQRVGFPIGFGLLPLRGGDLPFQLLGLRGRFATLGLLLIGLGVFDFFERLGDFRQRVVLFGLTGFIQSLFDGVAGLGDLFELFAGELGEFLGCFARFTTQFRGGFRKLVGGLQRLVGGLLGVRLVVVRRLVRRLPQLFFHLGQRLREFRKFLGSFGRGVLHAFRRFLGDAFDFGLFLREPFGVFFRQPLVLGGFGGVLGERPLGGGGSFERLGGAGEFTDFDGQFTAFRIGQLGGDFSRRLFHLRVGLGDRLFRRGLSSLLLGGVFLSGVLLGRLGHVRLVKRFGRFLSRLAGLVEPCFHDWRQLHRLGRFFQLLGDRLLLGLRLGRARIGRLVGLLLRLLGLGDFLLGLFQLSDLGGQLVRALAALFLVDRPLQLLGHLGEASEHFVLLGHRFGAFLFKDLLRRFQRRGLGLFQQRLGRGELLQFLRDFPEFLLKLLLLLNQFIAFRRLQVGLASLLAELLLLFHHLADHLERRFAIGRHLAAGLFELLQQGFQAANDRFLVGRRDIELAVLQGCERALQFLIKRGRFQHTQALGGVHRHIAAPRRQIAQRRNQLQIQRGNVCLILQRIEQQAVATFRPLVRQRLGHREHLRFVADQLPHLSAHSSDLQPAMQLLPLAHQFDHDVADALTGVLEMVEPFLVRAFLGFDEQLHDLFHLLRRQRVDMFLHVADVPEHRLIVESVFFELPNLQIQNAGDQFAGQQPSLFLSGLLLTQLFRVVRRQRGPHEHGGQNGEHQERDAHAVGCHAVRYHAAGCHAAGCQGSGRQPSGHPASTRLATQ